MRLTSAEKVFAHRLASGKTQKQAARKWGVSFWVYRSWEENPNAVPERVEEAISKLDVAASRYIILRRRHGMTQSDLAVEIGCSRQWVNRMERGLECDDALRDYWTP